MNEHLSNDEFRQAMEFPYPASDYLNMAYGLCSVLQSTPDGMKKFMHRIGLAKELQDEMVPLGYLCKYFYEESPAVEARLVLGNQAGDAVIVDRRSGAPVSSHVEITVLENETEHKKRVELHKTGVVTEIVSETRLNETQGAMLRKVLTKKSGKEYPSDTMLLVFCKANNHSASLQRTFASVADELKSSLSRFSRVLMASRNGILLDFSAPS
ncbi:hypothetical protein [Paraburkholderia ferrariae]|uniref:hypothetical protein n=1 Tax=Paraburkholderia ferrariae TaxID=386056 RepID=UPI00048660DA|nr:hypothetical protein [Paraburkholderia ferrariae]